MTMTTEVADVTELEALAGSDLGTTDWLSVDQQRIQLFADATDDQQWIHTDPERATKESPFGGPIAHGYLTLSLLIPLWSSLLVVRSQKQAVNYGLNKVRFVSPVPAGARIRLRGVLNEVTRLPNNGAQMTVAATIELEGSDRPACVAEAIFRVYE
ncbi:dehydratase [Enemella evansiae]|nr:dehydratase [Enemella evansiae]OYO14186.1 dehydratase [Enemella evansiae]